MKTSSNRGFVIPKTPPPQAINPHEVAKKIEYLKTLLVAQQAVVVAHYYTAPELQELAEQTGGFVGDSLAMAQFGYQHPAERLVVVGVRFMGESAKILSPEKQVLMPTLDATCSLDLGCPIDEFSAFCDAHPEREVVVYANTSAAVKARADWVVTSSNAVAIVDYLSAQGKKILWAPDRYLGRYVQKQTDADMLLWDGVCVVHAEFQAAGIEQLKRHYPEAAVLVHPEAPGAVVELADIVGSTTALLKASQQLDNTVFIVATDRGLFYQMQKISPNKQFIEAPTVGQGATCHSCAHCPWMAMNHFENLETSLLTQENEITLDSEIIERAKRPLQRMIHFQD